MADSASCQDARQVAVVSIKRNAAQARNRRRGKARTRSGLELLSALVHEERRDRTLGAPGRDYHSQKPRVMRVPRGPVSKINLRGVRYSASGFVLTHQRRFSLPTPMEITPDHTGVTWVNGCFLSTLQPPSFYHPPHRLCGFEMDGQAMVTEARLGSIGTRRKKAAPEPRAPQIFLTVLRRHDPRSWCGFCWAGSRLPSRPPPAR